MAWKRIFKEENVSGTSCYRELVMSVLLKDHPYIINIVAVWDCKKIKDTDVKDSIIDPIGLCYELGEYDLQDYVDNYNLSSFWLLRLMLQMIYAVKYIHGLGIIHRDIKPNNFIVFMNNLNVDGNYGCVKLCDFGHSTIYNKLNDNTKDVCVYTSRAPELLINGDYDYMIDIWSVGSTFLYMLTEDFLFCYDSRRKLLETIMSLQRKKVDYDTFVVRMNGRTPIRTLNKEKNCRRDILNLVKKSRKWGKTDPEKVASMVFKMLSLYPKNRPSLGQLVKMDIFKERGLLSLIHI